MKNKEEKRKKKAMKNAARKTNYDNVWHCGARRKRTRDISARFHSFSLFGLPSASFFLLVNRLTIELGGTKYGRALGSSST